MKANIRKEILAYVAIAKKKFRLEDWDIELAQEEPDASAQAHAQIQIARACNAILYVSHDLLKESPEEQRRVLCHELCHLVSAPLDNLTEQFKDSMSPDTWKVLVSTTDDRIDDVVERMARIAEQLMPLPNFSGRKS